jgi:small subunit ribosomal protein S16
MAVSIRLARFGAKKRPTYRIVVTDSRTPRDGSFMEKIGTYDPNRNPALIHIEKEKAAKWISRGAQPTRTVRNLMKKAGFPTGMTQREETG